MIFRQLFDPETSTYTYLLADADTKEAVLIDPVREHFERDRSLLSELGLTLLYTLETHVHADHVTSSGLFRQQLGSRSAVSARGGAACADVQLADGQVLTFGRHHLEARHTPGHTDGCVSFVTDDASRVFTGDALLIRGCGRTDFQQGDPQVLFRSVHERILSLPDDTLIYPGHDYKGRTVSTVAEEKAFNPRLGGGRSEAEFIDIMENLNLAKPKRIHVAVPANLECGLPGGVSAPATPPAEVTEAWAPITRTASGVPEAAPSWVADTLGQHRLIDVRRPDEFNDALGHVKGAELVTLDTLDAAAAGWDREQPLVTICRSGGRSGRAAVILENMGFSRVLSMAGGMLRWQQEGLEVERQG